MPASTRVKALARLQRWTVTMRWLRGDCRYVAIRITARHWSSHNQILPLFKADCRGLLRDPECIRSHVGAGAAMVSKADVLQGALSCRLELLQPVDHLCLGDCARRLARPASTAFSYHRRPRHADALPLHPRFGGGVLAALAARKALRRRWRASFAQLSATSRNGAGINPHGALQLAVTGIPDKPEGWHAHAHRLHQMRSSPAYFTGSRTGSNQLPSLCKMAKPWHDRILRSMSATALFQKASRCCRAGDQSRRAHPRSLMSVPAAPVWPQWVSPRIPRGMGPWRGHWGAGWSPRSPSNQIGTFAPGFTPLPAKRPSPSCATWSTVCNHGSKPDNNRRFGSCSRNH